MGAWSRGAGQPTRSTCGHSGRGGWLAHRPLFQLCVGTGPQGGRDGRLCAIGVSLLQNPDPWVLAAACEGRGVQTGAPPTPPPPSLERRMQPCLCQDEMVWSLKLLFRGDPRCSRLPSVPEEPASAGIRQGWGTWREFPA